RIRRARDDLRDQGRIVGDHLCDGLRGALVVAPQSGGHAEPCDVVVEAPERRIGLERRRQTCWRWELEQILDRRFPLRVRQPGKPVRDAGWADIGISPTSHREQRDDEPEPHDLLLVGLPSPRYQPTIWHPLSSPKM